MRAADWVDADLMHWGPQMLWIHLGKDGWPARSVMGKLIEEGVLGAGCSQISQHFPETLDARAIQINRVVKSLQPRDRDTVFIHYAIKMKAKTKAWRLGIPIRTYWWRVDQAKKHYSMQWHQLHMMDVKRATRNTAELDSVSA